MRKIVVVVVVLESIEPLETTFMRMNSTGYLPSAKNS